ncbi:peptide/nickel transport system ATP-binding protein [Roseovarius pacificus]|uniref:Glutathione import ATP-binding protein GsiA n=1 Tax=Roseovarius pacificus TaxID=337701 RepID=A0A1M7A1I3_9RHOB|nr:ABC transporter ATP-binding protein [Roseovarius pacificus]GGO53991.1 ABC transporter permease [Roseovarius pacificus]SHL36612.1 peptide/nickel transport system ATP-binding protein [Roseovarius pacificus]
MPEQSRDPVVDVRKLNIAFGKSSVVHDVDFRINAGETLAVVGESGSGKSVTSMAIMGLLPKGAQVNGSIRLGGQEVIGASERTMRSLRGEVASMIFQEPMMSLNPVLTVGAQVKEMLRQHSDLSDAEATREGIRLFDRVRIPDAARRFRDYPHMFSGGMRQRIMIAIALACSPRLLIADEPTTALDVTIQAQILDLLNEVQRESGTAILFVTHDMGVVANMADRVMVMRSGYSLETGPVGEIFERPGHDYTKMLIDAVPRLGEARHVPLKPSDAAAGKPILSVRNLVTRFPVKGGALRRTIGQVHAVEGLNFDLYPGETLSFVGESGCGKSTTGRSLLFLNQPNSGEIVFDGREVKSSNPSDVSYLRRNMQMVFQDPFSSLDPKQRIGDILSEPLLCHGLASKAEAREKGEHLLERVGLEAGMISRLPHEFSGGQRQRICIARALMLDPKVVIADEAVSALDVSVKAQVVDLMVDLQEELGLSYLFISHDMAIVERVSHRVAVMYMGEIVEIGPRDAVIGNPKHEYTQRLMAAVPDPDPTTDRSQLMGAPVVELPSPIRNLDYVPPARQFRQVGTDHLVAD